MFLIIYFRYGAHIKKYIYAHLSGVFCNRILSRYRLNFVLRIFIVIPVTILRGLPNFSAPFCAKRQPLPVFFANLQEKFRLSRPSDVCPETPSVTSLTAGGSKAPSMREMSPQAAEGVREKREGEGTNRKSHRIFCLTAQQIYKGFFFRAQTAAFPPDQNILHLLTLGRAFFEHELVLLQRLLRHG